MPDVTDEPEIFPLNRLILEFYFKYLRNGIFGEIGFLGIDLFKDHFPVLGTLEYSYVISGFSYIKNFIANKQAKTREFNSVKNSAWRQISKK